MKRVFRLSEDVKKSFTRADARKLWLRHGGKEPSPLGPDVMTIPANQFHDFVATVVEASK